MIRARFFLLACALVNGAGIVARLPYLPPTHPYFLTMGATFLLAVGALVITWRSLLGSLNLFCWASLPLIFLAAVYEHRLHPELTGSLLLLMPGIGLLALGILGRDTRSVLAYSVGAMGITGLMMRDIYGRVGAAGTTVFVLGAIGAGLIFWINSGPVQLARDIGEQKGRVKKITQELENDRRTIQRAYEASRQIRDSP